MFAIVLKVRFNTKRERDHGFDELYDCLVEAFLPNLSPFDVIISYLEV